MRLAPIFFLDVCFWPSMLKDSFFIIRNPLVRTLRTVKTVNLLELWRWNNNFEAENISRKSNVNTILSYIFIFYILNSDKNVTWDTNKQTIIDKYKQIKQKYTKSTKTNTYKQTNKNKKNQKLSIHFTHK